MRFFGSSRAASRRIRAALMAAALAGGAGVALAQNVGDTVWVERPALQLRENAGAGYPVVAGAAKGDQLKVLARNGKWLQVQTAAGVQGWVLENSLSAKKVGSGAGLSALAGGSQSQGANAGAAIKGLEQQAEAIAKARGQDPQLVERMIAERKAAATDWDQFMKEGGVGVHKQ